MDNIDDKSPLIAGAHKLYDKVSGALNSIPVPSFNPFAAKPDTSGTDIANAAFQKRIQDQRDAADKAAQTKKNFKPAPRKR